VKLSGSQTAARLQCPASDRRDSNAKMKGTPRKQDGTPQHRRGLAQQGKAAIASRKVTRRMPTPGPTKLGAARLVLLQGNTSPLAKLILAADDGTGTLRQLRSPLGRLNTPGGASGNPAKRRGGKPHDSKTPRSALRHKSQSGAAKSKVTRKKKMVPRPAARFRQDATPRPIRSSSKIAKMARSPLIVPVDKPALGQPRETRLRLSFEQAPHASPKRATPQRVPSKRVTPKRASPKRASPVPVSPKRAIAFTKPKSATPTASSAAAPQSSPLRSPVKASDDAVTAKIAVLQKRFPKWCKWQTQSLQEKAVLRIQLEAAEKERKRMAKEMSRQKALNQMLLLTMQHQQKKASREAARSESKSPKSVDVSVASSAGSHHRPSELIHSLLEREVASPDVSLSAPEQRQLWQEYKALSGELHAMSELVGVVRESLSTLATEKTVLQKQLDGRNQLVAELLHPREGGAPELTQLIQAMQTKMRMQNEIRSRQSSDDSVASIDQSFIIDRLQALVVGGGEAASPAAAPAAPASAAAHDLSGEGPRQSPCITCRLPVSSNCGRAVGSVGLVHDTCFRCSAFGCGAHLQTASAVVLDGNLFCPLHATTASKTPTKLCTV